MTDSLGALAIAVVSALAIAWVLRRRRIAVTGDEIAATLPWFAVVGIAVAIGRSAPSASVYAGVFRSPTIYLVVGTVVVGLWVLLDAVGVTDTAEWTAVGGIATALTVGGVTLLLTDGPQPRVLAWNAVAIVLAIGITGLVLRTVQTRRLAIHGWLGGGVVFSHILDATTTGVGLERLGTTERNPISAAIIQFGDSVGPSGVVLFLLLKGTVAVLVLVAVGPPGDRLDRETVGLLVAAAGVGLVPAVHNLTLFALTIH